MDAINNIHIFKKLLIFLWYFFPTSVFHVTVLSAFEQFYFLFGAI